MVVVIVVVIAVVVIMVIMPVVMIVIVVMMIMTVVVDLELVRLDELRQFLARHRLVGRLAETGHVVDDLVFEDRGAQLGQRLRVLTVEVVDLLFLAGSGAPRR